MNKKYNRVMDKYPLFGTKVRDAFLAKVTTLANDEKETAEVLKHLKTFKSKKTRLKITNEFILVKSTVNSIADIPTAVIEFFERVGKIVNK